MTSGSSWRRSLWVARDRSGRKGGELASRIRDREGLSGEIPPTITLTECGLVLQGDEPDAGGGIRALASDDDGGTMYSPSSVGFRGLDVATIVRHGRQPG